MRGHKSGLLTSSDYNNLCQCESLEDIKLHLVSVMVDQPASIGLHSNFILRML